MQRQRTREEPQRRFLGSLPPVTSCCCCFCWNLSLRTAVRLIHFLYCFGVAWGFLRILIGDVNAIFETCLIAMIVFSLQKAYKELLYQHAHIASVLIGLHGALSLVLTLLVGIRLYTHREEIFQQMRLERGFGDTQWRRIVPELRFLFNMYVLSSVLSQLLIFSCQMFLSFIVWSYGVFLGNNDIDTIVAYSHTPSHAVSPASPGAPPASVLGGTSPAGGFSGVPPPSSYEQSQGVEMQKVNAVTGKGDSGVPAGSGKEGNGNEDNEEKSTLETSASSSSSSPQRSVPPTASPVPSAPPNGVGGPAGPPGGNSAPSFESDQNEEKSKNPESDPKGTGGAGRRDGNLSTFGTSEKEEGGDDLRRPLLPGES